MAGSSVSVWGPGVCEGLCPKAAPDRGGAGAWPRSLISREEEGLRVCRECLGAGFWVDPPHPNAPISSWFLSFGDFSANSLCFTLQLLFCLDSFLLSGSAGLGPSSFLPGLSHLSLSSGVRFTDPHYSSALVERAPQDPAARGRQSWHRDENSWCRS
uniref:Uncharacterized protein n=1 Tax=Rousettus aegyptiacus TaxID=9407 RepID=A0A7J8CI50_ROUAE|nr:hypothetical protein HJG63_009082 [Rousettus aegyptiacus]